MPANMAVVLAVHGQRSRVIPPCGTIIYSDLGTQYGSDAWRRLVAAEDGVGRIEKQNPPKRVLLMSAGYPMVHIFHIATGDE